jgi:hypothetical protein
MTPLPRAGGTVIRAYHPRLPARRPSRFLIELTSSGCQAAAVVPRTLAGLEGRALAGLPASAMTGFRGPRRPHNS